MPTAVVFEPKPGSGVVAACPTLVRMKLSALTAALGLTPYVVSSPSARGAGTAAESATELIPDPATDPILHAVSSIGLAVAGSLVFAEDEATLRAALSSRASAVLSRAELLQKVVESHAETKSQPGDSNLGDSGPANQPMLMPAMLVSRHPKLDFARAARLLRVPEPVTGVDAQAIVDPTAQLGAQVSVAAGAILGGGVTVGEGSRIEAGAVLGKGVTVGRDCRIYPRAVLYPGVRLGDRVVVHAGAVLGADGFGYVRDSATGEYLPFPQQGTLVLEDDVEVGANATIDRGALEETRIGRGSKIDNLVQIGHNVRVGQNVVIAAQTGVSGSSTIGAGAIVAGQVGIADHVQIGEGAILGAQCGVPSNKHIEGKGILFWGTPARPIQQYLKELATLSRMARRGREPKASSGKD